MSRLRRATIALLIVVGAVIGLTNAYWFRPTPPQVVLALAPTATSLPPVFSATVAILPIPSATAQPTATLARRPEREAVKLKVAPTSFLPGSGPQLQGEQVAAGRRLDFYVGKNTFTPDQVARLSQDVEHALTYIQRRFQVYLTRRVSIGIYRASSAPKRGVRGMAYTSAHKINVYYRPEDDEQKALVILSHELAHQLQAEFYGDAVQSRADTVIHEGLATWISGEYWLSLSDLGSWQERARALYAAGIPMNITSAERNGPDVAYETWAGFVDYLTTRYGWDAFHQLYNSSRGRAPGSADYAGVYGKSLQELNQEWLETLK